MGVFCVRWGLWLVGSEVRVCPSWWRCCLCPDNEVCIIFGHGRACEARNNLGKRRTRTVVFIHPRPRLSLESALSTRASRFFHSFGHISPPYTMPLSTTSNTSHPSSLIPTPHLLSHHLPASPSVPHPNSHHPSILTLPHNTHTNISQHQHPPPPLASKTPTHTPPNHPKCQSPPPDVLRLTWNMTIQPLPQTLHTLGLISQHTEARILRFLLFSDHHRTIFVQVMDGGGRGPGVRRRAGSEGAFGVDGGGGGAGDVSWLFGGGCGGGREGEGGGEGGCW